MQYELIPHRPASHSPTMMTQQQPSPAEMQYELIPHRIFVGGFPSATTENELRTFFETFGHIREAKVIRGNEGCSKGYGFVTFDTEEEAQAVRNLSVDKFEFKGRRLNLGPAMRRVMHSTRFTDLAVASPTLFAGYYPQTPTTTYVVMPSPSPAAFMYSPVSPPHSAATQHQCHPMASHIAQVDSKELAAAVNSPAKQHTIYKPTNRIVHTPLKPPTMYQQQQPTGGTPQSFYATAMSNQMDASAAAYRAYQNMGYAGVNQSCPQSHTHPYNYPATATATNDMTHYSQMTAASHPVPATYYYTPTMVDKQYYFDTPPMMEGEFMQQHLHHQAAAENSDY